MSDTLCCDQPNLASAPLHPAATYFAPAGRDVPSEVRRKAAIIERVPTVVKSPRCDAQHGDDPQRQSADRGRQPEISPEFSGASVAELVEKRPGEAIKCIRAKEGPDGCGTGVHCSTCGAVNAILDCRKHNAEVVRECRILVQTPSEVVPLDLRVTASPFEVEEEVFHSGGDGRHQP